MKKLHLLTVKKEGGNLVSQYIKVTPEDCIVTDGHALAAVPTELIFDKEFTEGIPKDGCLIHWKDWQEMTKSKSYSFTWDKGGKIQVIAKGKTILVTTFTEDQITKYPEWEKALPTPDTFTPTSKIGIDCHLAYQVQAALGWSALGFLFSGEGKAVTVVPIAANDKNESDVICVIMPQNPELMEEY